MKCQWCGKEFTPLKSWQKYCSPACRVAANRKRLPKDEVHTQEAVLIRSFRCLQCGEVVNVYDPSDNRFKFCCVHCEKLYWKHSKKKREKAFDNSNVKFVGRMSLSRTLWIGDVFIAVRPVGKLSIELDKK